MTTHATAEPIAAQTEHHRAARIERVGTLVCVGLFALSFAYAASLHWRGQVLPADDAFITFRYAANLVAGRGLVYNEGERVFGASTPVFVLWSAGLAAVAPLLRVELPQLVVWTNPLWLLLAGVGLVALLRSSAGARALGWLAAALLLLATPTLWGSLMGMETSLFLAVLLWGAALAAAGRSYPAALLLGLATLTRPEGVVAAMLYAVWLVLAERRGAVGPIITGLAPGAVWCAFAAFYFGTPIPHSVIAKSSGVYTITRADAWHELSILFAGWWPLPVVGTLALALGLAVAAAIIQQRSRVVLLCLLGTWTATVVGYVLGRATIPQWYYAYLYGCLFVPLSVGLLALAGLLRARSRSAPGRYGVSGAAALALVLIAAPAAGTHVRLAVWGKRWPQRAGWRTRTLAYREAAEWINANTPASAVVLASEIGSFGYHCERRILDACGLVSPEALQYLPVAAEDRAGPAWGVIPPDLVRDEAPGYVVTMPVFARDGVFERAWFDRRYELVKTVALPVPAWGDDALRIYERRALN